MPVVLIKNVFKSMLRMKIINITLIITFVFGIVTTVYMYNYINSSFVTKLFDIPASFEDIIFFHYLPVSNQKNLIVTIDNNDLAQYRQRYQSQATLAPLITSYGSTLKTDLDKVNFTLFAIDHYFIEIFKGIPIKNGQFFSPEDLINAGNKIVISEGLSQKLFNNVDPTGKRLLIGEEEFIISGVVEEGQYNYISGAPDSIYAIESLEQYGKIKNFKAEQLGYSIILCKTDASDLDSFADGFYGFLEEDLSNGGILVSHRYSTLAEEIRSNTASVRMGNYVLRFVSFFGVLIAVINLLLVSSAGCVLQRKNHAIKSSIGIRKKHVYMESMLAYLIISSVGGILGILVCEFGEVILKPLDESTFAFIRTPDVLVILGSSILMGLLLALYNSHSLCKVKIHEAIYDEN
jgi:hypothetical protein